MVLNSFDIQQKLIRYFESGFSSQCTSITEASTLLFHLRHHKGDILFEFSADSSDGHVSDVTIISSNKMFRKASIFFYLQNVNSEYA